MAHDLAEALSIQQHLAELAELIKSAGFNRAYLTPDEQGYVLALQGERAKAMSDFMLAVGQYLMKAQQRRADKEAAKAELLRAFETWLTKQKIES